jgi:lipoprotein-anchoring transpeptidase ErfK/SrfK
VPIVIAIVVSSETVPARADTAAYIPSKLQAAPQGAKTAAVARGSALPPGSGALVAVLRHKSTMLVSPGGRRLASLPMRTPFGSPQVLWAPRISGQWLGVVSPLAGNGRLGWIPRSAASLSRTSWELRVSLTARRLTVFNNGKPLEHYTVAIGKPSAPTPTGHFAVTDRLNTNDPSGPYGCCILAISAEAPHAIQGWSGGNRIAIHSTPETSSIGLPVSHGCMRLTLAEGRWLLAHIPLGTPTLISS